MPVCKGFTRRIKVFCSNKECKEQVFEDELKIEQVLNIEEDMQGADVLTFECPTCGHISRSRRYG